MSKKINKDDLDLLGKLGVDTAPEKQAARSKNEQRIIAGFEEIVRFVEQHDRPPEHGENRDIFERIYAVRLDQLRKSSEYREILKEYDTKQLLDPQKDPQNSWEKHSTMDQDASVYDILRSLEADVDTQDDITDLKHVRSTKEKIAAEEIAQRTSCRDFGIFKPLFEQVKGDLKANTRAIVKCLDKTNVEVGDFYIVQGQTAYVAHADELFINAEGRQDCRLRIIFDNGTESKMLRRSLQKRLWEDTSSRRIIDRGDMGPLFSDQEEEEDEAVGYVYVLRSKSDNPFIAENRKVIHKIGITKGSVKRRIVNAEKDPTYLLAKVDIVETFKVSNLNLNSLEKLLHKFFEPARLDLQLKDRFGFGVEPREWFLVPLPIIEEAIQKLIDGTLPKHRYEPNEGRIIKH